MIEKFTYELERQGLSKDTIKGYSFDISQFYEWLKSKKLDNQLSKEVLIEYKIFLTYKYSRNTVLKKVKSVIRYNNYLYHIGESTIKIKPNEIITIKIEPEIINGKMKKNGTMKLMELNDLFRIREIILEGQNKRDILIFHLLLGTGCRTSELMNLELDDIKIVNPLTGFIGFKVSKSAIGPTSIKKIPITEALISFIKDYLQVRPVSLSNKLLIGQKGPLTRDAINKLFRKYSLMANIGYTVSPDMVRRMGILIMIKLAESKSLDLFNISAMVGHSTAKNYISQWSDIKREIDLDSVKTKYFNLWWENNEQKPE